MLIHRMKRGYEMNDTDKKVNKKSNLKIYIIFAIMILVSLLGGFLAGRLAAVNKDTLDGINWDNIWSAHVDGVRGVICHVWEDKEGDQWLGRRR